MVDGLEFFKQRQKEFIKSIGNSGIAVIFAARDLQHNRKTISIYRQDSDFYYLTGFVEPEAIAVFIPQRAEGEYVLFSLEKDPQAEVWSGLRIGQEKACNEYGVDQAFPLSLADKLLPQLMAGKDKVYFNNIVNNYSYEQIVHWVNLLPNLERKGINKPTEFVDAGKILHVMRMRKDSNEIALLRRAVEITASAQNRIMRACRPGMIEYELEAEVMHEFVRNGGRMASFEPIIAGGANGCVLHYTSNDKQLRDGDLVLADIGVEHNYYAGDVTRTFPVNGKFNPQQRAVYEAVLAVQLAIIKSIKPGVTWMDLQKISEINITEQLVAIGLLQGKVEDLWQQQAFKPFYMHFFGHWLGIDVHDVGCYNTQNGWQRLDSGMLLTVEPGIYIAPDMSDVDEKWRGIAVRIEDNVLVTKDGCEVLSAKAPKTVAEIEALMNK